MFGKFTVNALMSLYQLQTKSAFLMLTTYNTWVGRFSWQRSGPQHDPLCHTSFFLQPTLSLNSLKQLDHSDLSIKSTIRTTQSKPRVLKFLVQMLKLTKCIWKRHLSLATLTRGRTARHNDDLGFQWPIHNLKTAVARNLYWNQNQLACSLHH